MNFSTVHPNNNLPLLKMNLKKLTPQRSWAGGQGGGAAQLPGWN
jgi:hypothetical protein